MSLTRAARGVSRRSNLAQGGNLLVLETLEPRQLLAADLSGAFFHVDLADKYSGPDEDLVSTKVTVSYSIANSGNTASGKFQVKFYFSDDEEITAEDACVKTITVSVAAGDVVSGSWSVTLSETSDLSDWFCSDFTAGMIIDSGNAVAESNKDNNSNQGELVDYDSTDWDPFSMVSNAHDGMRTIGDGQTVSGTIGRYNDVDYFKFVAGSTGTVMLDIDCRGSSLDSYMEVYDVNGELVSYSDDDKGFGDEFSDLESFATVDVEAGQTYYILVMNYQTPDCQTRDDYDFEDVGGLTGSYTLTAVSLKAQPPDVVTPVVPISPGKVANGEIRYFNQEDRYQFTAAKSERMVIDIDCPHSSLDSYIAVYDSQGEMVADNDDATGPGDEFSNVESYLLLDVSAGETYTIVVSNSEFPSADATGFEEPTTLLGTYSLSVDTLENVLSKGTTPVKPEQTTSGTIRRAADEYRYKLVSPEADTITITFSNNGSDLQGYYQISDRNGEVVATGSFGDPVEMTLDVQAGDIYYLSISSDGDPESDDPGLTGAFQMSLSSQAAEMRRWDQTATPIGLDAPISGNIRRIDGKDMYKFVAAQAGEISVDIDCPGSMLDSYLDVYDSNGNLIACSDDDAGTGDECTDVESFLTFDAEAGQTYYFVVCNYQTPGVASPADYDLGESDFLTGTYQITASVYVAPPAVEPPPPSAQPPSVIVVPVCLPTPPQPPVVVAPVVPDPLPITVEPIDSPLPPVSIDPVVPDPLPITVDPIDSPVQIQPPIVVDPVVPKSLPIRCYPIFWLVMPSVPIEISTGDPGSDLGSILPIGIHLIDIGFDPTQMHTCEIVYMTSFADGADVCVATCSDTAFDTFGSSEGMVLSVSPANSPSVKVRTKAQTHADLRNGTANSPTDPQAPESDATTLTPFEAAFPETQTLASLLDTSGSPVAQGAVVDVLSVTAGSQIASASDIRSQHRVKVSGASMPSAVIDILGEAALPGALQPVL